MYRKLKSPVNVQFEITSKCNERCRHCYNYWRRDSSPNSTANMSKELFDACLEELIKNSVRHVIFTGGEPFFNFDTLVYGIRRANEARLSTTCNSNLLLADQEKLEVLHDAGLPHILTSLNSHNAETNDYITSHPGAFDIICRNIKLAVAVGIKISTNMIITQNNIDDIYQTGLLAHELGVSKFHITRVVPPSYITEKDRAEFAQGPEELRKVLGQTRRLEQDCDIEVKTLIPYPLCGLGDLTEFKQYIGRPCAAGKRAMSVDSQGYGHACWHMTKEYGKITELGLETVWNKMNEWRDGSLIPSECRECPWLPLCGAGCRVSGSVFYGDLSAPDNLRLGWESITSPYTGSVGVDDMDIPFSSIARLYEASYTSDLLEVLRSSPLVINREIRTRQEDGFTVISLMAGANFFLEQTKMNIIAPFLDGGEFRLSDLGDDEELAAYLMVKGVIQTA